jgi:HK97 family phage prohead protease
MTHLLGTRGHRGGLVVRRGIDFLHSPETRDALAHRGIKAEDLLIRATGTAEPNDSGGFEGWGCIFGVKDSYGTTFQPGCFTEGGLDESAYALLWMHSGMVPLGTFVAEERDQGLWIAGEYDATPDAQTARARALSGSARELSVGFVWLNDGGEDDPDLITSARLVETSQITLRMAAVPGAGMAAVRTDDDAEAEQLEVARLARERAHALLALHLV